MKWRDDPFATRVARQAFSSSKCAPEVRCNGAGVYQLQPSPFGMIELVRLKRGFAAAAEHPAEPLINPRELPDKLVTHFVQRNLVPWLVIGSCDVGAAIHQLALLETSSAGLTTDPRFCPMPASVELVGENRNRCAEQLGAVIAAQRFPGPLAQLEGIDEVGKKTMIAAIAAGQKWILLGELPLGRFFVDRVFENPLEAFFDLLISLGKTIGADDLIAVSDVELLAETDASTRRLALRELARLPNVVLMARPGVVCTDEVLAFDCPGLESADDARKLLDLVYGESIVFAGSALDLLLRAATVEPAGIIPGRLLFLIRLAEALLDGRSGQSSEEAARQSADRERNERRGQRVLAPDEVATAIQLSFSTWKNGRGRRR